MTVKCDNCGKEFIRTKSEYEKYKHHFCCKECKYEYSNKKKNPMGYQSFRPNQRKGEDVKCDWCGKLFHKKPSRVKKSVHHFCSKECQNHFMSKEDNPDHYKEYEDHSKSVEQMRQIALKYNTGRMIPIEVRKKISKAMKGRGGPDSYIRTGGRLEHRVVAEKKLGRQLKPEEVVHHMDFNKQNNDEDNLMVFKNNSDHRKYHIQLWRFFNLGEIPDEMEIIQETLK